MQVEVKKAVTKAELKELNPKTTPDQLACVTRPYMCYAPAPVYQQGA